MRWLHLAVPLACLATGCAAGLGPSTAASRPLLGQIITDDDATMWAPSASQRNVPAGLVRIEQISDDYAQLFNFVSVTSSVRKGSATPTIEATPQAQRDVTELDLSLTGRIPLPIAAVSFGVGYLSEFEGTMDQSGFGVRASVAPIGQVSLDVAHSWTDGSYKQTDGTLREISGTRSSVGGTLLIWGWNSFRFGVAVAKAWTNADAYTSTGYTYQLVSTMY